MGHTRLLIAYDAVMLFELMMAVMTRQTINANSQENAVVAQDEQLRAALENVLNRTAFRFSNKAPVAELV